MVLWDGSPHHWLGPDRPACCLMAAMDDATGKLLVARFFPFEGCQGICGCFERWLNVMGFLW